MGIVVTIAMLLGLVMSLPKSCGPVTAIRNNPQILHVTALLLIALGMWNSLWHGLRHLNYFWGIAGLISGVFMVLVGILLLAETKEKPVAGYLQALSHYLSPFKLFLLAGLLASFLLYAITLIQLNLGYPIIR